VTGTLEENCYIYYDEVSGEGAAIDPGGDGGRIIEAAESAGVNIAVVALTHGHFDHVGAVPDLIRRWGCDVLAGDEPDEVWPKRRGFAVSRVLAKAILRDSRKIHDDDTFSVGGASLAVIAAPGHTAGSVCYHDSSAGVLFSGDTLFFGSVGRTDFKTGNRAAMMKSLAALAKLPPETVVYPGHYRATTIGYELAHNRYMGE
jgi:glyoxylase-like metal-dependent hydrolase (beta-lactamase superfamily II)